MTGSGVNQKEKATTILWIKCGEKFSRNYNLELHIQRHHPEADVASLVDSRLCQCQLCSFKCYYVNALRQHLTEEHGLIFRTEHITFNSYSGEGNFSTWTDLRNVSPPTWSDFEYVEIWTRPIPRNFLLVWPLPMQVITNQRNQELAPTCDELRLVWRRLHSVF